MHIYAIVVLWKITLSFLINEKYNDDSFAFMIGSNVDMAKYINNQNNSNEIKPKILKMKWVIYLF